MSAKILPSLTEENRDLRKQIGCMNGIFQIFDRHHFLTGRRISSSHKRLLPGAQHQLDSQNATKALMGKDPGVEKEKPRSSVESSRPSYSSSSCSSTFSSLDCNKTAQLEKLSQRQINVPESPFQTKAIKEQKLSSTEEKPSLDLRDVVKDSMYREPRGLSIKSSSNDERRGHTMKHIDSPRPLQQSKSGKPKATNYEGSTRVLAKVHESTKDERLALPRFSYDGRESRETIKSTMKLKELPRLSLDSRASSMKCSALESRLNFRGTDLHMENENSSQVLPLNQEPGIHNRSSSVVAKLMGLEDFPYTVSIDEWRIQKINSSQEEAFHSNSSTTAEKTKQNQVTYSPRPSQNNPSSPSQRLHNPDFVKKPTTCSRIPMEPAPWRQQDMNQGSQKMAPQRRKASKDAPHFSSSVYGEIEKRITQLEFKKSGKDLRALKQILEAMQKTREQLESQAGASVCSDQNSNLSIWKDRKSNHQAPTIKGPFPPKQLGSSIMIMKPAKGPDKAKNASSTQVATTEVPNLQRLQTRDPKYNRENLAHRQKVKDLTPRNNNLKEPTWYLPPTDKKTTWRNTEPDRNSRGSQRINVEKCTTSGRSSGIISPRLQKNLIRIESQSHFSGVKKHSSKKLVEKGSQNKKHNLKTKHPQLSDDQLSEFSSDTKYSSYHGDTASVKSESNNSLASHMETEVTNLGHPNSNATQKENFVSTLREHMPAVELAVTTLEQPSPVSVLDASFYGEDSPSPVKKISTVFQDDSSSPDEAEWLIVNLNHSMDCTRSDHGCKYSQKSESIQHLVPKLMLLNSKLDETAANHNATAYGSLKPDHRYVNKILLTSGLLKDASFISTADQLVSSCHLINPEIFHVLEQTESIMEDANGKLTGKNDWKKLNEKIQRKLVFDLVNEILVHKITPDRLFTVGKRRMSPQRLLKEVYLKIDNVNRMLPCNLDEEEDGMTRLLNADMMYQSEDWADYSGEVPALVLDIERLIFKDLINEVVTSQVMCLNDWPKRHCRQLFTK
ncbi:hypothetical protein ACJIZ3_001997 [Penstemon smallii]|uniref:DUF4378 domain-containing protein n=1 Tax=Penstemon smallii TaxID=265156 RepID=A0ABD3U593_9LAMI